MDDHGVAKKHAWKNVLSSAPGPMRQESCFDKLCSSVSEQEKRVIAREKK